MDKMRQARTKLLLPSGQPWYGQIAMSLELVPKDRGWFESRGGPLTACTDGLRIYYYEPFVDSLSLSQCMGLIAHEVLHVAYLHHTRMQSRNVQKWNVAADMAINGHILSAGLSLPDGALGEANETRSAERIYAELPDDTGQDGAGRCGDVMAPSNEDGSPMSKAQIQAHESRICRDIVAATQQAKKAGTVPAGIEALVESLTAPKFNWRELLAEFVQRIVRDDYSYRRVNRGHLYRGFVLPGLWSESCGPIVFAADTSGSVSNDELQQYFSEASAICATVKPDPLYFVQCDAAINSIDVIEPGDEIDVRVKGRGGTDFRPVFDWIAREGIEPECLVYLTDGCGPAPKVAPPYDVLWISTDVFPCSWGQHVEMKL